MEDKKAHTEELKKHIKEKGLRFYIETYGCQMNVHDSEKIAGVLLSLGFEAGEKKDADLIIFNTCCVREHAEAKAYGNIGALREYKESNPGAVVAVCGCMVQQEGAAQKLQKRFPFVDMVFGTNKAHELDAMLEKIYFEKSRVSLVDNDETVVEGISAKRHGSACAFVNIMYGCDNFCSYCIVPYVRGRERSRDPREILDEINALCEAGVKEVTLLGQNVNSYGRGLAEKTDFADLLERIDTRTKIKRVRFMTSHPKDLTDALISCYGRLESLCEHIHLPVQSGSDRILAAMNRGYGRKHYMGLLEKLRARSPGIAVTTDIIVGFPGETEEDFSDTLKLVEEAGFDAAYTFAYSKRSGTKAAGMIGQIEKSVKSERLSRLNEAVYRQMLAKNEAYIGRETEVLAEGPSKRGKGELFGRTRSAKTVVFKGAPEETGRLIKVRIERMNAHTLYGTRL